jgi:small nuclear ribonucleoprotein D2
MASLKSKGEMTEAELLALEEAEFQTGPLSLLTSCVKTGSQVLIKTRNNRTLVSRVKALYLFHLFKYSDRHCNMVLENVKEVSFTIY